MNSIKSYCFAKYREEDGCKYVEKKITAIAWAISSSSASIIGAVAAIAEPPQIEEPTPTSIDVFAGTFKAFFNIHAITRDVVIVQIMIGSDCFPV